MGEMIQIAPSILSADFANLASQIHSVETGGAQLLHLDVMDNEQIIRVINKITETHKKIDILVNNAGSAQREPTETMPL